MYKIKHIIPLNKNLLEGKEVCLEIEGSLYSFKIEEVLSSVMGLTTYIKHEDIRNKNGSLGGELMQITYGKSKSQMETWQYAKSFTDFRMDVEGDSFKFEVKGVGNSAVKVMLFISFKQIDDAETNFCKELKSSIPELYSDEISRNISKLDDLKRKDDEQQVKQEKIREERRKKEAAQKEKFKDIAHLL